MIFLWAVFSLLFMRTVLSSTSSSTSSSSSEDYHDSGLTTDEEIIDTDLPISLQSRNFKIFSPAIWAQNMMLDLEAQWKQGDITDEEYLIARTAVLCDPEELEIHIFLKTNPFRLYTKNNYPLHDLIPVGDPEKYHEASRVILRAQARALFRLPYLRLLYLLITKDDQGLDILKDTFALILHYSRALELDSDNSDKIAK